jgi:hypothetical protein
MRLPVAIFLSVLLLSLPADAAELRIATQPAPLYAPIFVGCRSAGE